ncbi:DUF2269 family protein [Paenibacillus cremeus]|uniref:DUF2269 family protein n=1 Tax=Paenibacillus cremeus TaxID=2163881 RepID=A0A559K497_9BACL|nr:DUF2269 family protein [Paenibacillus cremeus]TVY06968.1 DUF2269 family protein [Paenibacillus cremeus]
MTFYGIILVVHILSAVCSLGAVFANPSIMKKGTTVLKAKQALETAKDVEKYAKIGSITLLISGLVLGILNPSLFSQIWYIIALALYLAVQPIVAYMIPKRAQALYAMLEQQDSDTLPDGYLPVAIQISKLDNIARASVFILIILMTLKPF